MTIENIAWCPICGDSLQIVEFILKTGNTWTYECFGCDKKFKIIESSGNKSYVNVKDKVIE